MNIYDAIMKAADQIEKNPELWDFNTLAIPECGTPGCALGWIGHFSKCKISKEAKLVGMVPQQTYLGNVALSMGLPSESSFYERINDLAGHNGLDWWLSKASTNDIARVLRLYAEKYHGHEKQPAKTGIPDSVRAIFEPKVTA